MDAYVHSALYNSGISSDRMHFVSMTHLHLQIVLANAQRARPGQMWPPRPERAAARLSWRQATATDLWGKKIKRLNLKKNKNHCNMTRVG